MAELLPSRACGAHIALGLHPGLDLSLFAQDQVSASRLGLVELLASWQP
jgi:hypothetical protein